MCGHPRTKGQYSNPARNFRGRNWVEERHSLSARDLFQVSVLVTPLTNHGLTYESRFPALHQARQY